MPNEEKLASIQRILALSQINYTWMIVNALKFRAIMHSGIAWLVPGHS